MNEDRKKRGLANGKFFTAVAICALFLGSGNVMAAQTASNDSQGVQEQMQSISVTVTVVDTKGEPIIGANVIEKGTTNGGITDLDGVSKLNVKPGAILQVSFVGYTTQEVKATSVMKVVLKDGSFHPVDSDQLSFEICAIQAYKNACAKAGPVLTEPIMKLEVVTPEENMGDVIGDLNKRRGQVEGMETSRSGARIVKAMVPLAEMFGYVTALRTITSGRATSSMTYDHHAQVSSSIAKTVLEEVKGRVDLV